MPRKYSGQGGGWLPGGNLWEAPGILRSCSCKRVHSPDTETLISSATKTFANNSTFDLFHTFKQLKAAICGNFLEF